MLFRYTTTNSIEFTSGLEVVARATAAFAVVELTATDGVVEIADVARFLFLRFFLLAPDFFPSLQSTRTNSGEVTKGGVAYFSIILPTYGSYLRSRYVHLGHSWLR